MKMKKQKLPRKQIEVKMKMILETLPEEVMTEILCRLPIKTLLQCISVCKSWYALIKNPNFISTHLHKNLSSNNNPLFLHLFKNQFSLRFDNKDLGLGEYMPLNPPIDHNELFRIAGSCNGLICLFQDNYINKLWFYRFILWNPSIRKSLLLHSLSASYDFPGRRTSIGFGFDSRTNDHKVLKIMNAYIDDEECVRAEVYSLNANSWKIITNIPPKYASFTEVNPAFVNGALHWIVSVMVLDKKCFIMVFDFRDEVFREILLPECLGNVYKRDLTIKIFRESSISVIHRRNSFEYDIWLMKEYGVVASWVKLATVGKRWRGCLKVMGFRNNGEVLMEFGVTRARIASQNPEHQRVKNLIALDKGGQSKFYNYMESLLLLDKLGNEAGGASGTVGSGDAKQTKTCN